MAGQMFNKEFYKLRRDFNPRVVPSVDFIPVPDVPGETYPEYNMPYPDPFGGELPLDAVKANPRRGSSTDKKDAFQNLLNNATGQLVAQMPMPQEPQQPDFRVPSQMPGAYNMGVGMGPGIDHGITGNLSDIQNRGGTPTLIDFGKGLEALKKGKERGGVMNDSTYEALQMLQGY